MRHSHYETLYALCQTMEWAADVETVYQRIVDVSTEFFECDSAHLHLLDIDRRTFVKHAFHYDTVPPDLFELPLTMGMGRMATLMNARNLIIMEDYEHPHADDIVPKVAIELGFRSSVSIPLDSSSGVLGILTIVYREPLHIDEVDHEFLLEVGRVLGTFLRRIQMSKKEVDLKVLNDRRQLSREIHDNVSQMSSALAIRSDIALSFAEEGDLEGAAREISYVADQARLVTKVLREEMLSLRTPAEAAEDIEHFLRSVFGRFTEQWGIRVHFESHCDEQVIVSEYVHLQLSRIVNECLQNTLRHAQASRVEATLDRKNGSVFISIRDDGVGFDPSKVSDERLGLRIMRERAKSAGGTVSIMSGSQGTTVFIDMPVARE